MVARHHGRVYRFLASFLRSPEDAADVTQETFLNAYRNAGSFRGEAAFRTWLLRIARHAGVSRLRATKRRGELGRSAPGGDVGDAADRANTALPDPAVAADVADRRRVVRDAIDALPEDQRAVVLLREVEGLDYDAIAAALEVPVGTVRSRLHRAREALRLKLEPYVRS
ncbi:MAG: sigma-70 family RNA polymerase sigma factor [Planctomycetota bacterium]